MSRTILTAVLCFLIGFIISLTVSSQAYAWSGLKQASVYGPGVEYGDYGGDYTASGKHITKKTKYVAVPMEKVVTKKYWMKHKKRCKKNGYFYYGEKLKLRHYKKGKYYYCTVTVQDCGGFGYCGQYYKGKWRPRRFDCTYAVKKALHLGDIGLVRYKVLE